MVSDTKPVPPHLTLFKNLEEFVLGNCWLRHASLDILAPIFSSFASTLKRLRLVHWGANICQTWKDTNDLTDLLPNLTHIDLLGCQNIHETHIRLLPEEGRLPASKRFKLRELAVAEDTPFSLPILWPCGPHLQVLNIHGSGPNKR